MKKTTLILSFLLLTYSNSETFNKIDKSYNSTDIEKGLHFYEEKKEEQKEEVKIIEEQSNNKAPKNETNKLLQEIVMVLKQQNNEIKELKKTINPNEPKMIVNKNGEPCLSNSSVDCFDIPVIQEGRNVPVLYDFIKEPNENNAKAWLLYQANLFNHYIKMGYALKFAAINGDENTYPVNALNLYGASKDNMTVDLYRDRILEILHEKRKEIGTMIFLGKTKAIDEHWGKKSLSTLAFNKGKFFNIAVVFDSQETKKEYDEYYKTITDKDLFDTYAKLPKIVSKELFKKFNISITPTATAYYKTKDKEISSVLEKGFITQSNLIHNYQHFLVYNDIVEQKEFHSAKILTTDIKDKLNEK